MEHFQDIIKSIKSQRDYDQQFNLLNNLIIDSVGTNTLKPQTKQLLDAINNITVDPQVQPVTKLNALLIVKDLTQKKYTAFISGLSSSALLQAMLDIGLTVDPQKPIEAKGFGYFPQPKLGNHYIRLILECIVKWSNLYPVNTTKQPTKLRLAHEHLMTQGVVLPDHFIFFPADYNSYGDSFPPPTQVNEIKRSQSPPPKIDPRTIEGNLRASLKKIEGLMELLQHPMGQTEMEMEISRYHKQFQQDGRRLENNYDEVMSALSPDWGGVFMSIIHFYGIESDANDRFLKSYGDVASYSSHILKEGEPISKHFERNMNASHSPRPQESPPRIFPGNAPQLGSGFAQPVAGFSASQMAVSGVQSPHVNPMPPIRGSIESLRNSKINDLRDSRLNNVEQLAANLAVQAMKPALGQPYSGGLAQRPSPPAQFQGSRAMEAVPSIIPGPPVAMASSQKMSAVNPLNVVHRHMQEQARVNNHLDNLLASNLTQGVQRNVGFKSIINDLEREKAPIRSKSKSPRLGNKSPNRFMSTSKSREKREQFVSDMSRDNLKMSVFDLHPGAKPTRQQYFGFLVPMGIDYYSQLRDMNQKQNLRRFKTSSFKDKSLILEDDYLQVGFKSKPIYDSENGQLRIFLRITLYFGNRGFERILDVDIEYEGDESFRLYGNPRKLQPTTEPGYQTKQELMLVPMSVPFNLVSMNVGYHTTEGTYSRYKMFLPTTILKFMQFKRITADNFSKLWTSFKKSNSIYCTAPSKLARNFPPLAIKYYMKALTELNDYFEFLGQRVEEHKMCCVGVLMLHEDYLLKLHIRADMSFVWRVAVPTNSPDAIAHGRFLIQTLQFVFSQQY